MKLSNPQADIYIPGNDATPEQALARVTHLCLAPTRDDIRSWRMLDFRSRHARQSFGGFC